MDNATTGQSEVVGVWAESSPSPAKATTELQDIILNQVRSLHRLNECLEQSRLRTLYYRRQAEFAAGLLRNIAQLRDQLNGLARDWHVGVMAVGRAEEGLDVLYNFQTELAKNIALVRRQMKFPEGQPLASAPATTTGVHVERTWLRDGTSNFMSLEHAVDNLVENVVPTRSAEVLREMLLCGQPIRTESAVFRLLRSEQRFEADAEAA